jgi:hypothetical protein
MMAAGLELGYPTHEGSGISGGGPGSSRPPIKHGLKTAKPRYTFWSNFGPQSFQILRSRGYQTSKTRQQAGVKGGRAGTISAGTRCPRSMARFDVTRETQKHRSRQHLQILYPPFQKELLFSIHSFQLFCCVTSELLDLPSSGACESAQSPAQAQVLYDTGKIVCSLRLHAFTLLSLLLMLMDS